MGVFEFVRGNRKIKSVDECIAVLRVALKERLEGSGRASIERALGETARCECGAEYRLADRLSQPAGWWFRFICPACRKETGIRHDE